MPKDIVEMLPDVGNMRQSVLSERNAEHASYAQYMADMGRNEAQKEENKKLQEIRKQRHGIDPFAQAPSTQAILARPKEKDEEHFNRPFVECQIRDSDGLVNVRERPLEEKERSYAEAIRRRPKNSVGQSEKSSAGEERKEAAVNAFICSPGVSLENLNPEERARIQKPAIYEEPPVLAIETKPVKKAGWDFQGGSTWLGNLLWKWRHRND